MNRFRLARKVLQLKRRLEMLTEFLLLLFFAVAFVFTFAQSLAILCDDEMPRKWNNFNLCVNFDTSLQYFC